MRVGVASVSSTCCGALALTCLATAAASESQKPHPSLLEPTDAYFSEYATLYDHVGMLADHVRMGAYHDAIKNNERHFKDKVVLDVGTGTGILSVWAAQAGARKVYAVEATDVAKHAEKLIAAHGFASTVTVLQGKMEEIHLPENVDVIVSEWMGYFLLRESMVQSVLLARDRWLAEGGVMYPSAARLQLAPLDHPSFAVSRGDQVEASMHSWDDLAAEVLERYSLDLRVLTRAYRKEHEDYSYRQAWQGGVPGRSVSGPPLTLLDVDMHTVHFEELFGWKKELRVESASVDAPVSALVGWFDVEFCADPDEAVGTQCRMLSTSPNEEYTHWAHTALLLRPPMTRPELGVGLDQSRKSHHDLNLTLEYHAGPGQPDRAAVSAAGEVAEVRTHASYAITNDFKGHLDEDEEGGEQARHEAYPGDEEGEGQHEVVEED